jgi:AraC-like DNA-binding protein
VIFGSDSDAILFTNTTLDRPNKLGDEGITQFLLGHLDHELAAVAQEWDLKDRIRDLIARSLSEGLPKMDDIARRLGISVRSLHRRLSADGLSFQALAEATRKELAVGLLGNSRHSLAEIARCRLTTSVNNLAVAGNTHDGGFSIPWSTHSTKEMTNAQSFRPDPASRYCRIRRRCRSSRRAAGQSGKCDFP